jgi:predicted GTPase
MMCWYLPEDVLVFAGVDYEAILREAEKEADVILWDGGNNDLSFYKADFQIIVADPHRPGHETTYHPGEANARTADVFVINKVDTANAEDVIYLHDSLSKLAPEAVILEGASPLFVDVVDPRPFAVGTILETYQKYPTTGDVLPAMGYGDAQIRELEKTINNADVDLVIIGTPIDLTRLMKINKPTQRVRYELQIIGQPTLEDLLKEKFS